MTTNHVRDIRHFHLFCGIGGVLVTYFPTMNFQNQYPPTIDHVATTRGCRRNARINLPRALKNALAFAQNFSRPPVHQSNQNSSTSRPSSTKAGFTKMFVSLVMKTPQRSFHLLGRSYSTLMPPLYRAPARPIARGTGVMLVPKFGLQPWVDKGRLWFVFLEDTIVHPTRKKSANRPEKGGAGRDNGDYVGVCHAHPITRGVA